MKDKICYVYMPLGAFLDQSLAALNRIRYHCIGMCDKPIFPIVCFSQRLRSSSGLLGSK